MRARPAAGGQVGPAWSPSGCPRGLPPTKGAALPFHRHRFVPVTSTPSARRFQRARQLQAAEQLRRERARHGRSRGSVRSIPPSSPARLSVSRNRRGEDRADRIGAAALEQRVEARPDAGSRRAASWTSTKSSWRTDSGAASPTQHRFGAGRATDAGEHRLAAKFQTNPAEPHRPGQHHHRAVDRWMRARPAAHAPAAAGHRVHVLLATSPPKPRPMPAAGTTAHSRPGAWSAVTASPPRWRRRGFASAGAGCRSSTTLVEGFAGLDHAPSSLRARVPRPRLRPTSGRALPPQRFVALLQAFRSRAPARRPPARKPCTSRWPPLPNHSRHCIHASSGPAAG